MRYLGYSLQYHISILIICPPSILHLSAQQKEHKFDKRIEKYSTLNKYSQVWRIYSQKYIKYQGICVGVQKSKCEVGVQGRLLTLASLGFAEVLPTQSKRKNKLSFRPDADPPCRVSTYNKSLTLIFTHYNSASDGLLRAQEIYQLCSL